MHSLSAQFFSELAALCRRLPRFRGKYSIFSTLLPAAGSIDASLYGVKFNLALDEYIQRRLALGYYEADELAFLDRILRPGDTFVDVGANIGVYSACASSRVGPRGRIIAIEPSGYAHQYLSGWIAASAISNIDLVRACVGASEGEVTLYTPPPEYGNHNPSTVPYCDNMAATRVPQVTLPDVLNRFQARSVRLMKLDIEGAEMAALSGARDLLAGGSISYLLCELNDNLLRKAGSSYVDMTAFLGGLGYLQESPGDPAKSFATVLFRHRLCAGAPTA